MKNCEYFKEQIMLEFYNEAFDVELLKHLETCADCKNFKYELNAKLSINADNAIKFQKVKEDILISSKKNINFFDFKRLFKFSAAAIVLIAVFSIYQYNAKINNKNKIIENQPVENKNFENGGENVIIHYFNDFDNEINNLENELKKLNEVI